MTDERPPRKKLRDRLIRLLFLLATCYVTICVLLYLLQDQMLFLSGATRYGDAEIERARSNHGAVPLAIEVAEGVEVSGFLLPGDGEGRRPTLLYFGGNAEALGDRHAAYATFRAAGWNVALVCYRGYGASSGTPSGEALVLDSLVAYDHLASRDEIDPTRMVVWGRSLGSGVAVHVAANRPVVGAILVSPYDRLSSVATYQYPWLPVGLLFSNEIDSIGKIDRITAPALVLRGGADGVIPERCGRKLIDSWPAPVEEVVIENEGHNTLDVDPRYDRSIREFLDRLRSS